MFLPQVGVRGLYTLTGPFSGKLIEGVQYTCSAVRLISDLINKGEAPYETYYKPYSITELDYTNDLKNNIAIITLEANEQHVVYVPATYISGYPEIGGVSYVSLMLGAQLGPIKEGSDLTLVKNKVKVVILQYVGVDVEVKIIAASLPKLISNTSSDALESAREANKDLANTDESNLVRLQTENIILLQKIALLETYIKENL